MIKAIVLINLASFAVTTSNLHEQCIAFFNRKTPEVSRLSSSLPDMLKLITPSAPWLSLSNRINQNDKRDEPSFVKKVKDLQLYLESIKKGSESCDNLTTIEGLLSAEVIQMKKVIDKLEKIFNEMKLAESKYFVIRVIDGYFSQVEAGILRHLRKCQNIVKEFAIYIVDP